MVPLPRPSKTLLLVLVVGVTLATIPFAVGTGGADADLTYQATAFDPASEADVLAHRSGQVANLTAPAVHSDRARQLIDRAADGEAVTVDPSEDNMSVAASGDGYAVYRGDYYYRNVTESEVGEEATLRLESRTPDEAMSDLAVPYEDAPVPVQRAVDRAAGTASSNESANGTAAGASGLVDAPAVVERGGTYYAIEFANVLGMIAAAVTGFLVSIVQRIGNVYLGVGLGVLGATALADARRSLTLRSATGVAAFAALVHAALVVLRSPGAPAGADVSGILGSLLTALVAAPTGFALAATLVVGVSLRPPRSNRRLLAGVGVAFVALVASAVPTAVLAGSVLPFFTTGVWNALFAVTAGLPLIGLGYVHAAGEREVVATGDSTTEPESLEDAYQ